MLYRTSVRSPGIPFRQTKVSVAAPRSYLVVHVTVLTKLIRTLLSIVLFAVHSGQEGFPLCPDERFASAKLGKYVARNSAKRNKRIEPHWGVLF
jgi:hypothetical protein